MFQANRTGTGTETGRVKLTPEMASFRLLVLAFVRDYIDRMGASPSYGEIVAGVGSYRSRVRMAVKSLAKDGLLIRRPGARGLALPDEHHDAIRLLRSLGWRVDEDTKRFGLPRREFTLNPSRERDYLPDPTSGERHDQQGG